MCDSTLSAKVLLAEADRLGLISGNNVYGIRSASKRKTDVCAALNKVAAAGVVKRAVTQRQPTIVSGRAGFDMVKQNREEEYALKALWLKEAALTGPEPSSSQSMCFDIDCSTNAHCENSMFRNNCHIKDQFLRDFIARVNNFQSNARQSTTLHRDPQLTDIPAADILHDLVKSDYYQLSIHAKTAINYYIKNEYSFADLLALTYFVVVAQANLKIGFPEARIVEVMDAEHPFATKVAALQILAKGLEPTGIASYATKKNMALAAVAMAGMLYGGHKAAKYFDYAGLDPVVTYAQDTRGWKWGAEVYDNILKSDIVQALQERAYGGNPLSTVDKEYLDAWEKVQNDVKFRVHTPEAQQAEALKLLSEASRKTFLDNMASTVSGEKYLEYARARMPSTAWGVDWSFPEKRDFFNGLLPADKKDVLAFAAAKFGLKSISEAQIPAMLAKLDFSRFVGPHPTASGHFV